MCRPCSRAQGKSGTKQVRPDRDQGARNKIPAVKPATDGSKLGPTLAISDLVEKNKNGRISN